MNVRSDLALAYLMGYDDALAKRMPNATKAEVLNSSNCSNNCTNGERTRTCHDTGESRIFHCSECGLGLDDVFIDDEEYYPFDDFPRFCPFCGAKVVEPTTNEGLFKPKPTVEDVLTEFGIDWEHESDCEDRAALLKEYAAKLRLAEEDA